MHARSGRAKKRLEAARRWAAQQRRGPVKDEADTDLQAMGLSAEAARAWLAQMREDLGDEAGEAGDTGPLVIWPENRDVWRLFMRLQTQWTLTPSGHLMALPHPAIESALRMMKLWRRSDELYEQLADMERAALAPDLEE